MTLNFSIKKTVSYLTFLLAFLIAMGTPSSVHASHAWGFELTMECLNTCSVRVHQRTIRDCLGGQSVAGFPSVSIYPTPSTCPVIPPLGPISSTTVWDVTPICNQAISACDSSIGSFGVEYHSSYRDFDYCGLPTNCEYTFSFVGCCRTYASQVFDANSQGFAQQITLKPNQPVCNNSPLYNSPWQVYLNKTPTVYDIGGIDPDGDSLSYALAPCMSNYNQVSGYQAGYSHLNPLGPNWTFDLDPVTGNLYVDATAIASGGTYICFEITEWRNGSVIGRTVRDMLLIPQASSPNQQPRFELPQNLTGGTSFSRDQFSMCLGSSISVDFPVTDPDSTNGLHLSWNQAIPAAIFSDAITSIPMDTLIGIAPTGRFQFTPSAAGTYFFQLHLEDQHCPLQAILEKTIAIHVSAQSQISALVTTCNTVDFSSLACGPSPATYQWSGDNGLASSSPSFSHSYPGAGTYHYQCIFTDANQNSDTLTDSVTVTTNLNLPLIDGPDSIQRCPNQVLILNSLPGFNNLLWSNGQTSSTVVINADGWFYLQAESQAGCPIEDSVWIESIPPAYASMLQTNGPTALDPCTGTTSITLSANTTYSAFAWSTGATTPTITVNQPGVYHLTGFLPFGCSEIDSIEITSVQPDISGTLTNSSANPFPNQTVYLLAYNTGTASLDFIDSTLTDNIGFYQFCNLAANVDYNVQAFPDPLGFPNEMPTYGNNAMVWNQTPAYSPSSMGPQQVDIQSLYGTNSGGVSTISGQILDSTNGLPVAGLRIFLTLGSSSSILGYRNTDANGWFEFVNLPFGTYHIVPDHPFVDEVNVPLVATSTAIPVQDSLDFLLHPTWLELLISTSIREEQNISFTIAPQPVVDQASLNLSLVFEQDVKIEVLNLMGQVQSVLWQGNVSPGNWRHIWEPTLPAGTYMIRVQSQDFQLIKKVVVMR